MAASLALVVPARCSSNGDVVAEERIDNTVAYIFSADETMDVGEDSASPVTDDYASGMANKFAGGLARVQIDLELFRCLYRRKKLRVTELSTMLQCSEKDISEALHRLHHWTNLFHDKYAKERKIR